MHTRIIDANDDYYGGAPIDTESNDAQHGRRHSDRKCKSVELDVVMVIASYADEDVKGMHIENLETMDVDRGSETEYTTKDGQNRKAGTVRH
ncbi:MAG: hypothetical protein V8R14_01110 [Clostridia bacterium]